MKSCAVALGVFAGVVLMIGMWLSGAYNGLVSGDQKVNSAWAQVESQYQRRFDLIPNLVNATKGAMKQEQSVFGAIAEARTHYANAKPGSDDKVQATAQYESALARLLVVMENYPELKSLENVKILTDELAGTENRVLVSRDRYNEQVRTWNTDVKRFPTVFLASLFGFKERAFFQADEGASKAPTVSLE